MKLGGGSIRLVCTRPFKARKDRPEDECIKISQMVGDHLTQSEIYPLPRCIFYPPKKQPMSTQQNLYSQGECSGVWLRWIKCINWRLSRRSEYVCVIYFYFINMNFFNMFLLWHERSFFFSQQIPVKKSQIISAMISCIKKTLEKLTPIGTVSWIKTKLTYNPRTCWGHGWGFHIQFYCGTSQGPPQLPGNTKKYMEIF